MLAQKVKKFISEVKNLKVAVVGETIIDEFAEVVYEGQSMKSLCPVFKIAGKKKQQLGGAAAIANHLKGFVKHVDFITNTKNEIVKTRFIDIDDKKKHVEINKINSEKFEKKNVKTKNYDLVIVADFGHGFCNNLTIDDGFHLMCQTNSNNFGFNRVSKWKNYRKKSVCLDLREASLHMNRKFKQCTDDDAKSIFNYEINSENLFITVGREGSIFTNGKTICRHRSFPSKIVDTIGAGDTFFAFSALCSHIETSPDEILIIPSLAASLSTTWLCNEKSVTPKNLSDYAAQFVQ